MEERTIHFRPPLWLPPILALILGGSYIAGKVIEVREREPTVVSVTGEGKVYAVPDIAELTFGVQTGRQGSALKAMDILRGKMTATIEAVKAQGIPEKDIQTQSLSLYPSYDYNDGVRIDRGFEASQTLHVKVRDLAKVGAVLQAAVSEGANEVGGVSFTVDKPEALEIEARAEAITEAQEKAKELAKQLGRRVGELRGFSEGGGIVPPIPFMAKGMALEAFGGDLPVPAGEQEIMVTVTLEYELE